MLLSRCFKEDSDDTESLMLLNVPLSGRNGVAMAEGNVQASGISSKLNKACKLLLSSEGCGAARDQAAAAAGPLPAHSTIATDQSEPLLTSLAAFKGVRTAPPVIFYNRNFS
jgi:hypothetical protein